MESETNGTAASGMSNGTVMPASAGGDVLDVKSEVFRAMNKRRGDLIFKMHPDDGPGGLTAAEQAEYERLDQIVGAAIDRAYPRPTLIDDVLAAAEAHIRRERQSAREATASE